MSKSRDAFRTISEVSEWLETPAHVLRFWESKFTQVKPVKRAGGRRYYRPADMQLLAGIKQLLHEDGMTIKGAQKVLREKGVKHVSSLSEKLNEDAAIVDDELVEDAPFIEATSDYADDEQTVIPFERSPEIEGDLEDISESDTLTLPIIEDDTEDGNLPKTGSAAEETASEDGDGDSGHADTQPFDGSGLHFEEAESEIEDTTSDIAFPDSESVDAAADIEHIPEAETLPETPMEPVQGSLLNLLGIETPATNNPAEDITLAIDETSETPEQAEDVSESAPANPEAMPAETKPDFENPDLEAVDASPPPVEDAQPEDALETDDPLQADPLQEDALQSQDGATDRLPVPPAVDVETISVAPQGALAHIAHALQAPPENLADVAKLLPSLAPLAGLTSPSHLE